MKSSTPNTDILRKTLKQEAGVVMLDPGTILYVLEQFEREIAALKARNCGEPVWNDEANQ